MNTKKQLDNKEENLVSRNSACFDSVFQTIKADESLYLLSDINDYKEVLTIKEINDWMDTADTSNMVAYRLTDGLVHNYLIFCASQWAGTGIGSDFYIWLLIDMDTGYNTSNINSEMMSMSNNQHTFYIQNHELHFVNIDYGSDFYTDRDKYYSDSLSTIRIETSVLNKKTFKFEKVSFYETICSGIIE
jgi:hypothetical protein